MLTASEISPEGLAIALTLLEGDRYRQIMPCDYLANQCGHSGYNNVDAACSVNHKIILWIKQSLLHYDALQSRAAVLKFFINTANVRSTSFSPRLDERSLLILSTGVPQTSELPKPHCNCDRAGLCSSPEFGIDEELP